jgi:hypothetical protein
MQVSSQLSNSPDVLNRSIDRFLLAAGWRVTDVVKRVDGSGYDVTLSRGDETGSGHVVTRHGGSAGEATLRACSSARKLELAESARA